MGIAIGGGGGPGSDTTAVHRADSLDPPTAEAGSIAITGRMELAALEVDWGIQSVAQSAPYGFAAALNAAVPVNGDNLPTGDTPYTVTNVDWNNGETLPATPITVTIPGSPTEGVRLTWDDQAYDTDTYPKQIKVYRNNNLMEALLGTATGWDDDGTRGDNASFHPPSTNGTGSIAAAGPVFSHNRPVAELGVTSMGTIIPDTLIVLYDASGTAYHIPAKAVP